MNTSKTVANTSDHSCLIIGHFTCQSTNVVYVLQCDICDIQYVGEISNTMNVRCREHENSIRTSRDYPVAVYYRSYNHTIEDFTITIVAKEEDKK